MPDARDNEALVIIRLWKFLADHGVITPDSQLARDLHKRSAKWLDDQRPDPSPQPPEDELTFKTYTHTCEFGEGSGASGGLQRRRCKRVPHKPDLWAVEGSEGWWHAATIHPIEKDPA